MSMLSIAKPKPLPNALSDLADLHPFSQVKLIAFDLDGTLISNSNDIFGERLVELFRTVLHSNIQITLATGRTLTGVTNTLEQLTELNKIPLVLYNGSVLMRSDEEALIALCEISSHAVSQIIEIVQSSNDVSAFIYCIDPEASLLDGNTSTETVYYIGIRPPPKIDFNGMPVRPKSELDLRYVKIVAVLIKVTNCASSDILLSKLKEVNGISCTKSGQDYIELRPAGSSKAIGLKLLCDRLNIKKENVLAVGDNDNDVELLTWAGISVSVDNSSESARAASGFYSSYGAGMAAIEVLETIRRAKRLFKGEVYHGPKSQ